MNKKQDKMNFQDYYNSLKTQYLEVRNEICVKLEISEKTFYNKLNDNNFTYPQQVVIAQLLKKQVSELFPNNQTEKVA